MRWYVACTKKRKEYQVEELLKKEGFECFLPSMFQSHVRKEEKSPLFPGYLFVKVNSLSLFHSLLYRIPGLFGLVTFNGIAPEVPEEEIENLKKQIEEMERAGKEKHFFQPGEQVRIFLGLKGAGELRGVVLNTMPNRERVKVLMEFLGRLVRTVIPYSNLQPVKEGFEKKEPVFKRRTRGKGRYLPGVGPRAFENKRHPL